MAESSSLRRSGRKRQANRKYSVDALEGLYGLASGSEADKSSQIFAGVAEEDVDFANDQENNVLEDDDIDQDKDSGDGENESPAEQQDADIVENTGTKESSSLIIDNAKSDHVKHTTQKHKSVRYQPRVKKEPADNVRSRGLTELASKNPSKEDTLKFMAGAHPEDWVDHLRSRDRWLTDPTVPTRAGSRRGQGGMCHHFSHTEEKREMEATVGWEWYYDQGGREQFTKRQRMHTLTRDEGLTYIPKPMEQSHRFLMGPYGKQQLFNLQNGQSMCLNDAWDPSLHTDSEGEELSRSREGWLLNLGTSVKCLDWATNQDGDMQYLAATTAQPKASPSQGLSEVSPAFTPSPPLRSCIQIWEFEAKEAPGHETLLDSRQPPTLQRVICTEWGEIKQLKWCQVPRLFQKDDFGDNVPLGLLAGVWSDGLVRVLDIYLDKNNGVTANYIKYDEPAFKAWAPNTLCTCVTWLSSSNIAVGFANGFLAIWDISQADPTQIQIAASSSTFDPWLYIPIHQSYILSLTSAYPSYPHLLSTACIDGYARLTDLRAPTTDFTWSVRSRNASPLLVFSPALLSIISTEENDFARLFPLRTFNSSIAFARATGSPLCLATNSFHPSVLIGCADGSLIATNPLPRIWNRRWPYYQQTIFRHEWTQGNNQSGVGIGGISRITESYKLVYPGTFRTFKTPSSDLSPGTPSKPNPSKPNPNPKTKTKLTHTTTRTTATPTPPEANNETETEADEAEAEAEAEAEVEVEDKPLPATATTTSISDPFHSQKKNPVMATIYEENTGITHVAWNPNLKCGGWMAAGTGCGLVRVQDLAV